MNIAVALRLMPNLGDELEIDGADIDREIVDMVINEFDDQALEEAVLIKEASGATVTALALDAEGAEQALRVAYARGADRIVLIDAGDLDPYDTRTAAKAFAQAARDVQADAVLTGVQTSYDVFGQLPPYLAAELGWPQASVVVQTTIADGTARVTQEYTGGRTAILGLTLPAVVGVQSASSPPRYISMARLRQAMSEASAESMSVSVDPQARRPQIVALSRPEATTGATMIEGSASEVAEKIAAVLRDQGALMS